jgi:hypothetical protein
MYDPPNRPKCGIFTSMASWITACAALLAALLAVLVLLVAVTMQRALQRRFAVVESWVEAYRVEQWRQQADRVCAWPVSERETFEKIITRGVVGAAVRNGSASPVYQMELVYHDPDAAWTAIKRIPMVPPTDAPEVYAGFDEDKTEGVPNPERVNADGTIRLAASADMHLELRFTDGQGRRWIRDHRGVLTMRPAEAAESPSAAAAARDAALGVADSAGAMGQAVA